MSEPIINITDYESEADTCRKDVLPKIYASQWTDEQILGLKFAYSTNGTDILEFDFITGLEKEIKQFPTPTELWNRLNSVEPVKAEIQETFLKPFFAIAGKEIRYYQRIAINTSVKAILEGKKRALLTLATGTGKTTVAFQIIYKLWNNRWNVKGEHHRPKILFIADRSILVTDPHAKDFSVFGDARCLVPDEGLPSSREVYFSTYQSLAEDENRTGAFRKLPRDFFDLIVIDECHRGSSSDESQIRPDIISAEPIRREGNEIEIVNAFGGIDKYKQAIEQLQTLLYAEAA